MSADAPSPRVQAAQPLDACLSKILPPLLFRADRKGIFGFLASDELRARDERNTSGVFGLQDQTLALEWVKGHIASFNGDPNRVTLFGESAGATSVSMHMVMPDSAGLFHGAMIDSGAFNQWTYRPWSDATDIYNTLVEQLGCFAWEKPFECMLSKPTEILLNISDTYYGNCSLPHKESLVTTQWAPAMDGVIIPGIPADILAAGKAAHVPVLLGSNKNEGSTFLNDHVEENDFDDFFVSYFGPTSGPKIACDALYRTNPAHIACAPHIRCIAPQKTERQYVCMLTDFLPACLPPCLSVWLAGCRRSDHYRPPTPAPGPPQPGHWGGMEFNSAAQDAAGDFDLRCPTVMAARHFASLGQPTYLYSFDHAPFESINWPGHMFHLGAFHGAEVPYVFYDSFELVGAEQELSATMATYYTNFAATGDPNTKGRGRGGDRLYHAAEAARQPQPQRQPHGAVRGAATSSRPVRREQQQQRWRQLQHHYPPGWGPPPPPPNKCNATNASHTVLWPRYSGSGAGFIDFDLCNVTVQTVYRTPHCDFWEQLCSDPAANLTMACAFNRTVRIHFMYISMSICIGLGLGI